MKDFIKQRLREALNELELTNKFKTISYPDRVEKSWLNKDALSEIDRVHLSKEVKNEIIRKIHTLDNIIFSIPNKGLGLIIYTHNSEVYYDDYPKNDKDKGKDLHLIIKYDEADSIYWKPIGVKPDVDDVIKYEDLMDYIKGKKIGTNARPITLNTVLTIKNIRHQLINKFKTIESPNEFKLNNDIMVVDKESFTIYPKINPNEKTEITDDILDKLPQNIQDYLFS